MNRYIVILTLLTLCLLNACTSDPEDVKPKAEIEISVMKAGVEVTAPRYEAQ
jgi:hypothetical protein